MAEPNLISDPSLAAAITYAASKQTYGTVRLLVDRDRVDDAFRAYAYFRWLDDCLDEEAGSRAERLALVQRQQALLDGSYLRQPCSGLTSEESLLADLIRRDTEANSGLQTYIRNMMAVMAFDAERRGRQVGQRELDAYTHWLAVAVTEAMHYFIGHGCASPQGDVRYLAVTGAHITHMLRDTLEDARMGYYNIPREVLATSGIAPWDVQNEAYRAWVKESVRKARACFRDGRDYLARVESLRCRMAGYAYIRRFEVVLGYIEREDYLLRAEYPERKGRRRGLEMIGWALWMALSRRQPAGASDAQPIR